MEAHGVKIKDVGHSVTHGSMAQMFAVVAGILFVVIGVVGMIVNMDFSTGSEMTAEKVVFLDVNGWSSILHLLTGLVLLAVSVNAARAKMAGVVIGGFYLLLTVYSLFDNSILGMLPVNDLTAILYAAIGVIGLTVGLGPDRPAHKS